MKTAMEFDEAVFKFVRKLLPNLKSSDFQTVKNKLILLPKFNIYPMMGNKGTNSPFDDYSERHFYSIGIKPNGYYKIIFITELYYHFNKRTDINIEDINCKEFVEYFGCITHDLSKMFYVHPIQKPEPRMDYCQKVMNLIGRID